jgi:hypothetical protein
MSSTARRNRAIHVPRSGNPFLWGKGRRASNSIAHPTGCDLAPMPLRRQRGAQGFEQGGSACVKA